MTRPKALVAWSSGKDSAFALQTVRDTGDIDVVGLLTTVNSTHNRVAMHGVPDDLVRAQADALGLPLWRVDLPWPCPNEVYESAMTEALTRAKRSGIQKIVFGDLFLQDIREYRELQMADTGLDPMFPLWLLDTRALAHNMLASGIRAILACVDPKQLDPSFTGREFDEQLLADLPPAVDPCGENGEFHTFVYGSPAFSREVPVRVEAAVERDGFWFADIRPGHELPTKA